MPANWISGCDPSERLLAVDYNGDQSYVWDIARREPVLKAVPGIGCTMTAEGKGLLVATVDRTIALYSFASGGLVQSWPVPDAIQAIAVEPHGKSFGGFRHGSSVFYVLDLPDGRLRWQLNHPLRISSCVWSSDGNWLWVGCYDLKVHVWALCNGNPFAALQRPITP